MRKGGFRRTLAGFAVTFVALAGSGTAFAHGLLLKLDADGPEVSGTAYFTNGAVASDEWVEWQDLDAVGDDKTGAPTDSDGRFRFVGVEGHRYRVRAFAEEGHTVELELRLEPTARPKLVDDEGAVVDPWWPPPAWLVIGGLLVASIPFARLAPRSR